MGWFTSPPPSPTRPVAPPIRSQPLRAVPYQSTFGGRDPVQPRSFGHIELQNDAVRALGIAAKAPAYIAERPIAAVDSALGTLTGAPAGSKGPLEQGLDFLRRTPLGAPMQAVGDLMNFSASLFPAVANSRTAVDLRRTAHLPDDAPFQSAYRTDPFAVPGTVLRMADDFLHGRDAFRQETVGEFRAKAAARGFGPAEIDALVSGQRDIWSFSGQEYRVDDNPLLDAAGRLVFDPLNIAFVGGAGALRHIPKLGRLVEGWEAIDKVVDTSKAAMSTVEAMRAIRAGDFGAATLNAMGRHLAAVTRGVGAAASAYRKVAVTTTAAQLSVRAADALELDNTPLGEMFEGLFETARRMESNEPLSNNHLFQLWTALNFPVRDSLSDWWSHTRADGLKVGPVQTPILRRVNDIERRVVDKMAPGKGYEAGRQYLVNRFGGEQGFSDFILHYARSRAARVELPEDNALTGQAHTSLGAQAMAEANNRVVEASARAAIEEGRIIGRDIADEIDETFRGPRSFDRDGKPETNVIRQEFDPERAIDRWLEWSGKMRELNMAAGFQRGGNVVIGVMDGLLPKEHLEAAKITLKNIAGPDGIIPRDRMQQFLDMYPSLTATAYDKGSFFSRQLTRDAQPIHYKMAWQRIDRLKKQANTMRQYLWNIEQWEARADKLRRRRGSVYDEHGNIDPSRAPDIGNAGVLTDSVSSRVRRAMGLGSDTYDDVLAARSVDRIREREDVLPVVMDDAGFNLGAATQGVGSRGHRYAPQVAIHLNSARTAPDALELAGAIAARQTGSQTATVFYSGPEALHKYGLTRNAAHFRWDIGAMPAEQTDALLAVLSRDFDGRFHLNDTAGVLHLIVEEGREASLAGLQPQLAKIVGQDRLGAVRVAPAWVNVIFNDTRKGARGRPDRPHSTVTDIERVHATDTRLIRSRTALRDELRSRRAVRPGGVLEDAGRPGFQRAASDERTPAGSPDLGPDGRGVDASGTRGEVLLLPEGELALDELVPHWDASMAGLPEPELNKLRVFEADMRRYDPTYKLKALPKHGTPYYAGQGNAIKDLVTGSRAVGDLLYESVWKPSADFFHALFGRVYTRELAKDAKQELYAHMLNATASLADDAAITTKQVDAFLGALDHISREQRLFSARIYARGDMLPPSLINEVATGQHAAHFPGFSKEAISRIGPEGFSRLLDRTASSFWRKVDNSKRDNGKLGNALSRLHGVRGATATPRKYIQTWYHFFRFTLDPRWHIMNRFEADILGLLRYGLDATNLRGAGKPEAINRAYLAHAGAGSASRDLMADALASGMLDKRRLEGYISRSFNIRRKQSTRDVLRLMAEEDPAIRVLRRDFGGDVDEWVDELERMMYDFDTKGVKSTIDDIAEVILDEADRRAMEPLLTRLYSRNQQIFEDVVNTFHGNTNRSRMERILNSYFLYWPLSYQLKASKWLFDVLTKGFAGRKTNLGGAVMLNRLYEEHIRRMAQDEEYQRMFVDNPALWQTASMLLPMTPFDMGVSLSRIPRYALAYAGVIEESAVEQGPMNAALRIMTIGPAYSIELARRIERELQDRPKDLVVPLTN